MNKEEFVDTTISVQRKFYELNFILYNLIGLYFNLIGLR